MKIFALMAISLVLALSAKAVESEVYRGEPYAEALHDIVLSGAIAISHQLVQASPMERTDVFKLRDGRILVLFSTSEKLGEPYSIKKLSVAPSAGDPKELELVSKLKLSSSGAPTR